MLENMLSLYPAYQRFLFGSALNVLEKLKPAAKACNCDADGESNENNNKTVQFLKNVFKVYLYNSQVF